MNELILQQSPLKVKILVGAIRNLFKLITPISQTWASRIAMKLFTSPPAARLSSKGARLLREGCTESIVLGDKEIVTHVYGPETGHSGVVLLVHGWGGRGSHMRSFVAPLLANNHRVILFDGPAHGESSGKTTDMVEFSCVLNELAKHYNGLSAIIGHSFGSACSLLAIKEYDLKLDKLVLVGCFSDAIFITDSFGKYLSIAPKVIAMMRERIASKHGNKWTWNNIAPSILIKDSMLPTLLIHDEDDGEVPIQQALELQNASLASTLFKTTGRGHRNILYDAGAVDAAVEFIG